MKQVSKNLRYSFVELATLEQPQITSPELTGAQIKDLVAKYDATLRTQGKKLVLGNKANLNGAFTVDKEYHNCTVNMSNLDINKLVQTAYGSTEEYNLKLSINIMDDNNKQCTANYKVNEEFWNTIDKINSTTPLSFVVKLYNGNKYLSFYKIG